jgi:hypothetical protein
MAHDEPRALDFTPDPVKMAYLAGFFDGEGSVSITRKKTKGPMPQHVLQVSVAQIDLRPLSLLREAFGGNIYPQGKAKRNCWAWMVAAQKARPVLQGLLPYLLVKKRDAEIGLAFLDISHREKPRTAATPERVAQREGYRGQLAVIHGVASSIYRNGQHAAVQAG